MPVRRACSVVAACACAVAGLAGCSSSGDALCAPTHCQVEVRPARAYALDVTTAGRVRWRVPLGPPPLGSGLQVSPLAVSAVAVFAQDDVLYGLRLADGHRLWSSAVSADIAGMWRWQNLVIVLTQPSRPGLAPPVLTGLDASTGQLRWRLPIGGSVEGFSPTADGGLAIAIWSNLGDGVLELVELSSGRVRWTVPVGSDADPPVAVGGGAVLYAANSQLTSYDDRTGQVRWTEALSALPGGADEVVWQASTGLVYLTGSVSQGGGRAVQVLLGISAADGRVRWRVVLRFAYSPAPDWLDSYAPGLVSVDGTSQAELDPATGRVRWQVVTPYPAIASPAGIVTAAGPDQLTMRDTLTGQARWTAGVTGGWLPLVTQPGQTYQAVPPHQALPVFLAGPLLVVPTASPDDSDLLAAFRISDGYSTWQITIPAPLAAPLSAVPGGMLVYTAIPQRILAP
jgi:outer membrane protein assembly factor BamB